MRRIQTDGQPHSCSSSAHSNSFFPKSSETANQSSFAIDDSKSSVSAMAITKTRDSVESSERDRSNDGIEISGKERVTFAPILEIIDVDAICKFASTVRQSGHQSTVNDLTGTPTSLSFITCKVDLAPFSGSYNIVFAIEFTYVY